MRIQITKSFLNGSVDSLLTLLFRGRTFYSAKTEVGNAYPVHTKIKPLISLKKFGSSQKSEIDGRVR